jgi:hypothetical protein
MVCGVPAATIWPPASPAPGLELNHQLIHISGVQADGGLVDDINSIFALKSHLQGFFIEPRTMNTTSAFRGTSTLTFFRLWSRAPSTRTNLSSASVKSATRAARRARRPPQG